MTRAGIIVGLSTFFLFVLLASARPGREWPIDIYCTNDRSKREICQQCAKQTKSNIVYPMCCNDEDDVYNWCSKYTSYGKMS